MWLRGDFGRKIRGSEKIADCKKVGGQGKSKMINQSERKSHKDQNIWRRRLMAKRKNRDNEQISDEKIYDEKTDDQEHGDEKLCDKIKT